MKRLWFLFIIVFLGGCFQTATRSDEPTAPQVRTPAADDPVARISRLKQAVAPFFKPMGKPLPTDWLATFKEPGQTFEEYIKSEPVLPTAEKRKIYVQPIGKFSVTGRKILRLTADYLQIFYNLPVVLMAEKPFGNVPRELTRKNSYSRQTQIKTDYFVKDLLPKIIPADAAALICFTDADLFPTEDWSYVFGQASLQNRVGVWSLYRLGNPDKSKNDYNVFLMRTLKIAAHETGHMFSFHHCTKYECMMSGTNNLNETDRRPPDDCPECAAKIWWAMNYDPAERYRRLAKFWAEQNQPELSREFAAKEKAVADFRAAGQ